MSGSNHASAGRRLFKRAVAFCLCLFCAGSWLLPVPSLADESGFLFDEGNRLYRDGEYRQALEAYQQVLELGYESGELFYNIGNCHFKLGDLGQTVLNYERAQRRLPGDPDVRANLELVNSQTRDEITPLPRFWLFRLLDWWIFLIPRTGLIALTGAFYLLSFAALITRLILGGFALRAWSLRTAVFSAALFLAAAFTLAAREGHTQSRDVGVVLVEAVSVKSAPGDDAGLDVFTIHEGTKVRVDQVSGEWAEVVLLDGKVGWIPRNAFEII